MKAAIIFISILCFFIIFGIAGHYQFDMGYLLGRCGFRQNTGLPCPTCGMTTAAKIFAQGKILQAFYIQPACALLCSLMVLAAVLSFVISVFGVYFRFITRLFTEVKARYYIIALLAIILAGWAVTLTRALIEKYS